MGKRQIALEISFGIRYYEEAEGPIGDRGLARKETFTVIVVLHVLVLEVLPLTLEGVLARSVATGSSNLSNLRWLMEFQTPLGGVVESAAMVRTDGDE